MEHWLLSQRWDDLLFAHWRLAPGLLRPLLPAGVEPDVREGYAWMGVVAFRMTETRAAGLLPSRGLGPIPELNVRTYVRIAGEPGVWFLSLDTSSPLFVTIGRTLYGLAYRRARMVVTRHGARFHYASTRGPNSFIASYEPTGPARCAVDGSLEHWLVERYRLYALRGGRLVTAEVKHPPWALQTVDARIDVNTLEPRGIHFAGEPLLHYSPGVDAVISFPERVAAQARSNTGRRRGPQEPGWSANTPGTRSPQLSHLPLPVSR